MMIVSQSRSPGAGRIAEHGNMIMRPLSPISILSASKVANSDWLDSLPEPFKPVLHMLRD